MRLCSHIEKNKALAYAEQLHITIIIDRYNLSTVLLGRDDMLVTDHKEDQKAALQKKLLTLSTFSKLTPSSSFDFMERSFVRTPKTAHSTNSFSQAFFLILTVFRKLLSLSIVMKVLMKRFVFAVHFLQSFLSKTKAIGNGLLLLKNFTYSGIYVQ